MTSVLYVSYTGLLEPLGQSQVLQYLLGLAKRYRISLLTFEKPDALADVGRLLEVEERCSAAGIEWRRLVWHRRPAIPATLFDIVQGVRLGTRIARRNGTQIVHCRSYVSGVIGLAVKKMTGARFVFDMRGFWADERVDGGLWSPEGFTYRAVKRIERWLLLGADHVVSLTRAGAREIAGFPYLQDRGPPISVIPTCTNLEVFSPATVPLGASREFFTLGYVGSAGSWYLFEEVARAVARLFERDPEARFLVINQGGHEHIRRCLAVAGVDPARVEIRAAPFDEVPLHIGRMDAGIFFIKPAWSKRASCPTRMGEFLACGKPCLANAGVGDVEEDLQQTATGVTIPVSVDGRLMMEELDVALDRLREMAASPGVGNRCRAAAESRFSLESGVRKYGEIYDRLAREAG